MTAPGEKSADAFRTISEVAQDLNLPQHVLRFWETRFTQIKPLKRGGNRRYYRRDDIELLKGIRHLLYADGYTIKGVQRLLREHSAKAVAAAASGARFDRSIDPGDMLDDAPEEPQGLATGTSADLGGPEMPAAIASEASPRRLSPLDRQRLNDAFAEIAECERILAAARAAAA